MSIKLIAAILFMAIIISLVSALFQMMRTKDNEHSAKVLKALKYRISLSLLLFIALTVAIMQGWVQPTGIAARMQQTKAAQEQPKIEANQP